MNNKENEKTTIIEILKDNTALGQSNDLVDQGRAELATELLALLREKGFNL